MEMGSRRVLGARSWKVRCRLPLKPLKGRGGLPSCLFQLPGVSVHCQCSWLLATAVCPLSALFPRGFAPSRDLLLCASLFLEGNRPSRPRGPPCSHATSPYLTKRINLQRPFSQIRSHSQVPGVGLERIFLGGALHPPARAGGDGQQTGRQGCRQAGLLKPSSGHGWPRPC